MICSFEGEECREWVRDIWNVWFDEVFPPVDDEEQADSEVADDIHVVDVVRRDDEDEEKK